MSAPVTDGAELAPCPFCGGAVEWEYTQWDPETETGDDGIGCIECRRCHVRMTDDRDAATERWNDRRGVTPSGHGPEMASNPPVGDTSGPRADCFDAAAWAPVENGWTDERLADLAARMAAGAGEHVADLWAAAQGGDTSRPRIDCGGAAAWEQCVVTAGPAGATVRRAEVTPWPAELGGGWRWRLRLLEDGEEVGGGVFRSGPGHPGGDNAFAEAVAEGQAWVQSHAPA